MPIPKLLSELLIEELDRIGIESYLEVHYDSTFWKIYGSKYGQKIAWFSDCSAIAFVVKGTANKMYRYDLVDPSFDPEKLISEIVEDICKSGEMKGSRNDNL